MPLQCLNFLAIKIPCYPSKRLGNESRRLRNVQLRRQSSSREGAHCKSLCDGSQGRGTIARCEDSRHTALIEHAGGFDVSSLLQLQSKLPGERSVDFRLWSVNLCSFDVNQCFFYQSKAIKNLILNIEFCTLNKRPCLGKRLKRNPSLTLSFPCRWTTIDVRSAPFSKNSIV